MTYRDIVRAQLAVDEGRKEKLYVDSLGIPSIGIGRNLRDVGLRPDEIDYLFENDLKEAEAVARTMFPSFDRLSDNRKAVVLNMAFNLGYRLSGFRKLREAVEEGAWERAAAEMKDSTWATQVGRRADRLAEQMRAG